MLGARRYDLAMRRASSLRLSPFVRLSPGALALVAGTPCSLAPLVLLALVACSDDAPASGTPGDTGVAAAQDAGPTGAEADAQPTPDVSPAPDADASTSAATFTLTGRVTYDHVPAAASDEGGPRLDYTRTTQRPARRIRVHAVDGAQLVVSTTTDDDGRFTLEVPRGRSVAVRADAHLYTTDAQPDGVGAEACRGAHWDAQVVDNTRGRAPYTLATDGRYTDSYDRVQLNAALIVQRGLYVRRSAAPFALLDTVLTVFELVCTAEPAVVLPRLVLNWSPDNRPTSGDEAQGEIGTSFHRAGNGQSNIYILGKEGVDTDELDDHVIAHETGHYLENWLYRSDSGGGNHLDRDVLEPAVAFAEGWGNALSGMALEDVMYVDTKGEGQVGGFDTDVSAVPRGDDRGVYSENSAQYLLWQLYDRRDPAPVRGRFDRIHAVLRRAQRETLALTSQLSFAAAYHAEHGPLAEDLRTLWSTELDGPYDALCLGACTGVADAPDPFDTDDDLGRHYGETAPRHYPDVDGVTWPRAFWTVHAPLVPGRNTPTAHEQTRFGNYDSFENKWGNNRYYRYQATRTGSTRLSVSELGGAGCGEDVLDLYVYRAGVLLDEDESTSGCPEVTFPVRAGEVYLVQLQGLDREVDRWVTTVRENKPEAQAAARLVVLRPAASPRGEATVALEVARARGEAERPLWYRARGLDGLELPSTLREWRPLAKGQARVGLTVVAPEGHTQGLLVVDLADAPGRVLTTAAVAIGAPGSRPRLAPLGAVVDGVVQLP